eukprot:gnl/Spiro4/12354_TR6520_c0_g1_i1.p1 gnl/Spiro4/12354_TR6520_c0_g1~~gnl/Spiro4/12354_TR6520_c0_g1_i1.p1  ORF type:complete len:219 (-),score=35.48 gnl/Spiro4/12354_TR6520_c0_g1_i1:19-675(-)
MSRPNSQQMPQNPNVPYTYKVVLLGQARVGKTSLIARYIHNTFDDQQPSTLPPDHRPTAASFSSKRLLIDGKTVILNIWDTAGQERFHALGPIYYRDADAALLVYDITSTDTLEKVKDWIKELRRTITNKIPMCIAANKIDLERNRRVDAADANNYAASVGAEHIPTSAKQNKGIDDCFLSVARQLLASSPAPRPTRNTVQIFDDMTPPAKRQPGCCG